jgi:alpha-beta hydrolase superfamily lysophospholipase
MFQSEADLRVQIDATQQLFKAIAAAAPQGEYRLLDNASHSTIPMQRPDAVADAITDMVKRQSGA